MTLSASAPARQRRRRITRPPNTVVAYIRVSTDEQANSGAGLAAQRSTIEAECARRGWSIVGWYADEGISGGKGLRARPGLASAVEAVEDGHASVLVSSKLDRLSRSVLDTALLGDRAQKNGWQIMTCDAAGIDTSTPMGEAMVSQMAVFSQLERRLISQRTREALAEKKAQGVRLGRPSSLPAEVVERIVKMRDAGLSYPSIAAVLNDEAVPTARGGAKWYPASVRSVEVGQDAAAIRNTRKN